MSTLPPAEVGDWGEVTVMAHHREAPIIRGRRPQRPTGRASPGRKSVSRPGSTVASSRWTSSRRQHRMTLRERMTVPGPCGIACVPRFRMR